MWHSRVKPFRMNPNLIVRAEWFILPYIVYNDPPAIAKILYNICRTLSVSKSAQISSSISADTVLGVPQVPNLHQDALLFCYAS